MTDMGDAIGIEGFLAGGGYLDRAVEAARVRAVVWQVAQQALQEGQSAALTLAGFSAMVTRSAAHALGMDEDELVHLLRSHRPH